MDLASREPCRSGCTRFLVVLLAGIWIACATSPPIVAQDDLALWYEMEAINPDLAPLSKDVDRSSPRANLRSFVDLAATRENVAAVHLMELSKFPDDEQKTRGSEFAARLASVIDRKLRID